MKWFGLTGGIASGKSAVARMLTERGVFLIDADQVAREVVEPGEPTLARLVETFGAEILDAQGRLDRARLGALVFGNDAARARLNAIMHPAIALRSAEHMQRAREAGEPFVVYDAALIIENGLHHAMDGLAVVTVPPEVQFARLMARDGLDEDAARARIASQIAPAERLRHATWVIDNSGSLADTEAQVVRMLEAMVRGA